MVHEYEVSLFQEFLTKAQEIKNDHPDKKLWYRGQNNADWQLTPGIFRHAWAIADRFGNKYCRPIEPNFHRADGDHLIMPNQWHLLKLFQNQAQLEGFVAPKNQIQWLEFAQHYGLPTLLLDWTTDPLVALFFAVSGLDLSQVSDQAEGSIAVWMIDPVEINRTLTKNDPVPLETIPNSVTDSDIIKELMDGNSGTICFTGTKSHPRICRQSGNFTFTGTFPTFPLDFVSIYQPFTWKITIPYSRLTDIREFLELCDLTEESIYYEKSELDKHSARLTQVFTTDFIKRITEEATEAVPAR